MGFEIGSRSEMQIGFLSGIAKFIESLLKKTAGAISKDFPPTVLGVGRTSMCSRRGAPSFARPQFL